MSDVNTLLWQTEIFLSMSTKVADPALAATLQRTADSYLARATEAAQQQQPGKVRDVLARKRTS